MSDTAWKQRERQIAAWFGSKRKIGSGSQGRDDETCSDSHHPTLFIECKHYMRFAVVTLWDKVKKLARKEGKTPVLCLAVRGRPGFWVMMHCDDLLDVATERQIAEMSQLSAAKILTGQTDFLSDGVDV